MQVQNRKISPLLAALLISAGLSACGGGGTEGTLGPVGVPPDVAAAAVVPGGTGSVDGVQPGGSTSPTTSHVNPDGSTTTGTVTGPITTTTTTWPNGVIIVVVKDDKGNTITTTTRPNDDGSKTTTINNVYVDGTTSTKVLTVRPDGTSIEVITDRDGTTTTTTKTIEIDGSHTTSITIMRPDGKKSTSVTNISVDGLVTKTTTVDENGLTTVTTVTRDGKGGSTTLKIETRPDGTVVTTNPDGSTISISNKTNPDGSTVRVQIDTDPTGKVTTTTTMRKLNGDTVTEVVRPDGSRLITTVVFNTNHSVTTTIEERPLNGAGTSTTSTIFTPTTVTNPDGSKVTTLLDGTTIKEVMRTIDHGDGSNSVINTKTTTKLDGSVETVVNKVLTLADKTVITTTETTTVNAAGARIFRAAPKTVVNPDGTTREQSPKFEIVASTIVPPPRDSANAGLPQGAHSPDQACTVTQERPYPVILVPSEHVSAGDDFSGLSPLLANKGYCVYTSNYPYSMTGFLGIGSYNVWGAGRVEDSAGKLASLIASVKDKTKASKVILIGHSSGGVFATKTALDDYPSSVDTVVALGSPFRFIPAGVNIGTIIGGFFSSIFANDPVGASVDPSTPFMQRLSQLLATVPKLKAEQGLTFATVNSATDTDVAISDSQVRGDGVQNFMAQDFCPNENIGHFNTLVNANVAQLILHVLDPIYEGTPTDCVSSAWLAPKPVPATTTVPAVGG